MSIQNNTLPDNPNIEIIKAKQTGLFTNYIYKAIPLAFDESMSYYETLCGLLSYLKDTILPTLNNNADAVSELQNLYVELKTYVDDYFTNLDVQEEINNKLDALVEDGTLTTLIGNYIQPLIDEQNEVITQINNKVNSISSGTPIPVSSINQMTDTTKAYLLTTDGYWYYYDGTSWTRGTIYQSTGIGNREIADYNIADKGITLNNINGSKINSNYHNIIYEYGKYLNNNVPSENANFNYTDYIPVKYNDSIYVNIGLPGTIILSTYDKNKSFIEQINTTSSTSENPGILEYTIPNNVYYVRFNITKKSGAIGVANIFNNYLINNKSIFAKTTIDAIDNITYPYNLYNVERNEKANISDYVTFGKFWASENGVIVDTGVSSNWYRIKPINVKKGDTITLKNVSTGSPIFVCDNDGNVLFTTTISSLCDYNYIVEVDSIIYCNIYVNDYDNYDLIINNVHVFDLYGVNWITLNNEQIEKIRNKSVWYNKDLEIFGDSLVSGTVQDGNYVTHLSPLILPNTFTNKGISGRPMANGTPNGVGTNTTINEEQTFNYDLIIIACGTNDFKLNVPLGNLGLETDTNLNTNTFYGAYKDALNHILSINPSIRIILWTPLQRDNDGYDVNYVNSAGHKLIDYVNAIKNIGQMYSIPVLDLYSSSGVTKRTLNTYTRDGLHLNSNGYDLVCRYIANYLNTI